MRILRLLGIALCGLAGVLAVPANAADWGPGGPHEKPGFGDLPDECIFEEGDLGHYIVVFYDWVEDPGAVARQQVERYGGNLGFVYTSAIKGYSAAYLPESATVLQAEPTVDYVSVDQLIWIDESAGDVQWHSCPLAPPLGSPPDKVEPPDQVEPPEETELPEEPGHPGSAGGTSPLGAKAAPPVRRCGKGKVTGKKGSRCVRRRAYAKRSRHARHRSAQHRATAHTRSH